MPKIKIRDKEYYVSDDDFNEIKINVSTQEKIKELSGLECVPIYLVSYIGDNAKDIFIGYIAGKIIDRIVFGKTEKQV